MVGELTPEQEKRLGDITSLPESEQKEELERFLVELTPEQIESLRRNQAANRCPFCLIVEGKIPSFKVYEDDTLLGILDISPANRGHTILFPKQHSQNIIQLPDSEVAYLLSTANKLMHIITEAVGAKGSNLYLPNGIVAGQNAPHILVHLIPRFEKDGINFSWQPKRVSEEEMTEVKDLIISRGNNSLKKETSVVKPVRKRATTHEMERIP